MTKLTEFYIKDLAVIKSGKRLPKGYSLIDIPTTHPYIKARDIGEGKVNDKDLQYLSDDTFKRIRKYIVETGDVCITIVGANIGDVGIIGPSLNNANLTENAVRLTNFKEHVSPTYIGKLLAMPFYKDYMDLLAGGAAQPKLGIYKIEKIRVNLPSLPIQQRIASIVNAYDELMETNNYRINLLEETARELYKEWFVRMRFPGYRTTKFVKGIPDSWSIVHVANAFETTGGGTPDTTNESYWDGDINWYSPTDITAAETFFLSESKKKITAKGLKESSSKLFPAGCLMMTSRATIAALGINTTPACTNQGFITCIPNDQFPKEYLYFWILSNKEYFEMLASGATFLEISRTTFRKVSILKPDIGLIKKYQGITEPIFQQIENLQSQNINLRQIRDRLLPRLVSGKLQFKTVKQQLA
ncbi:MAG TPA: restriction endonuclease subunit S [Chryseolinea sp.]|nr:restriction endonuclease subunit S [Chryseolinea sp.]HPM29883.1 restriction endonuclease subunit S [Chryseolinea sp.]